MDFKKKAGRPRLPGLLRYVPKFSSYFSTELEPADPPLLDPLEVLPIAFPAPELLLLDE